MIFNNEESLGYLLIAILMGFGVLIFFLIKARDSFQQQDLQLSSENVWKSISEQALRLNLAETNLIFGIFQDDTASRMSLLVKNIHNEIVGKVQGPFLFRRRIIEIDDQVYTIEFPLTWKRTAILRSSQNEVLVNYKEMRWVSDQEFEIPNYGIIKSERSINKFSSRRVYTMNGKPIGLGQNISEIRMQGKLIVLPKELPLVVRVFVLSI